MLNDRIKIIFLAHLICSRYVNEVRLDMKDITSNWTGKLGTLLVAEVTENNKLTVVGCMAYKPFAEDVNFKGENLNEKTFIITSVATDKRQDFSFYILIVNFYICRFRGRGIATLFLNEVEKIAKANECGLFLTTCSGNGIKNA